MNYELKLIDTNEPSNISFCEETNSMVFGYSKGGKHELTLDTEFNKIVKLSIIISDKSIALKKVIATNSPTLTPNCYIHEDKVKEFVEY
jgi:hypothetical protein